MSGKSGEKRTQNSTIKVRLYPTPEQAALLDRTFESCRWLWNAILADEQEFYAATGEHFLPTPARYKKEAPFLKDVDSQALVTVHQNLRRAFQDFFDGKRGYPQRKRPGSRDAFTTYCHHYEKWPSSIRLTQNAVHLPKLGDVKAKLHRRPPHRWLLKSATVTREPSGKYYCSLLYAYEARKPAPVVPAPENIGAVDGPAPMTPQQKKAEEKLLRMERKLSHMLPGSNRYEAQSQRIRVQREHIANQRRDAAHKESRRLADAYDAVRFEGGSAQLREKLGYKLERQGKSLIEDPQSSH